MTAGATTEAGQPAEAVAEEAGGTGAAAERAEALERDARLMRRAIAVGERTRRLTAPSPWVGALLVAEDGETVLGEGFHRGPGTPHAEVMAFREADARGVTDFSSTTLYSTLEPCHRGPGKRTPPCDELVVTRKVRRCVVGVVDPDKSFGGVGVDFIRKAGIPCDVGAAEEEVGWSLRPYLHHRRCGRPYVVMKIATSLDGRIGCADGTSQWITQAAARQDGHRLRADSQAILVGSGTALQDRPSLTARLPESDGVVKQPLRVVLDTRGRVTEGPLMNTELAPTLVFTSAEHCSLQSRERWRESGVECCDVPLVSPTVTASKVSDNGKEGHRSGPVLDIEAVLCELGKRGVLQLMVEGGAVVQGELLQRDLCDELRVYLGATLLGGTAQPWARTALTSTISEAKFWRLRTMRQLDDDVCMEYVRRDPQRDEGTDASWRGSRERCVKVSPDTSS